MAKVLDELGRLDTQVDQMGGGLNQVGDLLERLDIQTQRAKAAGTSSTYVNNAITYFTSIKEKALEDARPPKPTLPPGRIIKEGYVRAKPIRPNFPPVKFIKKGSDKPAKPLPDVKDPTPRHVMRQEALEDLLKAARLIKTDPATAELEIIKRVEELDRLTPYKPPKRNLLRAIWNWFCSYLPRTD